LTAGALAAGLAGCANPQEGAEVRCTASMGPPMLVFDLFFGRAVPARGEVSDSEWHAFLNRVVTPNLPNGYTIYDGVGAWMNPVSHKTIEEATKVLLVALPDAPTSLAAINRIRVAYQVQFHQQRVGMAVRPGCGSF
jgi:hypothetical protein